MTSAISITKKCHPYNLRNQSIAQGASLVENLMVSLEDLKNEPYASIVCYPKSSNEELKNRLCELEIHGVTEVEFAGKGKAFNIPVLGKGYVGVVVTALRYGQRLALKIRRVDADRPDLLREAKMLEKANSVGVGPTLVDVSKNFLLMQCIDGELLPVWLKENADATRIRYVLHEIVEQCWHLDVMGLDHGELSKAPKHVIVDEHQQPWIVDFETSSDIRKAANVTAICQYLFMSLGPLPRLISNIIGERNRDSIIKSIRNYKMEKSRATLDRLLKACLY